MSDVAPRLILASQSPRRAQLLQMMGFTFDVRPADIDETYRPGEAPGPHAERLAREKAVVVAADATDAGHALVVGSDTVVVLDEEVLGKPRDDDEAVRMLLRLSGRAHVVQTGIAVVRGERVESGVESVDVRFRVFDEATARAYVATGEPHDKAGAYGIQGFGAALVEGIEGDFFAVMGLPIARMLALIERHGWSYDFTGLREAK